MAGWLAVWISACSSAGCECGRLSFAVFGTGGMGRARVPKPGTLPALGQCVAYLPDPGWRPTSVFPDPDQIPWTHVAAPDAPDNDTAESDEAAVEEWGDGD